MSIDLTKFMLAEARRSQNEMGTKLKRARGVQNRRLPRKKIDNRRPLGFGKSVAGIPGLLLAGIMTAGRDRFLIRFTRTPKVGWFHRGDRKRNRPPRKVAGLNQTQRKAIERRASAEIAKQITEELRRA